MVLNISISEAAEAQLKAKAAAAGVDVETYVTRQVELVAAPPPSLTAMSGSISDHFTRSGMTEDELSDFLEEEKHAMRRERRARP